MSRSVSVPGFGAKRVKPSMNEASYRNFRRRNGSRHIGNWKVAAATFSLVSTATPGIGVNRLLAIEPDNIDFRQRRDRAKEALKQEDTKRLKEANK
jgi:hypothetical protein